MLLADTRATYDVFEDGAANARHADAERKVVAESSAKLHRLQLGKVTGSLQSHSQQSADPCRQETNNRLRIYCPRGAHVLNTVQLGTQKLKS